MIKIALAIACGIIAIIGIAASIINAAVESDNGFNNDVDDFLNYLDDTRDIRYQRKDRSGMLPQYGGYRHEWYAFEETFADNFSLS